MTTEPQNIVIAGGGVAGVEALLGLRALAGDRVDVTLVAPDPDFRYRPLAVAEPFAQGHVAPVPLARFTEDTGATLVLDAVTAVDDAGGVLHLRQGGSLPFDALLLAPGGRPVEGVAHATTWWPGGDADVYGGLLSDLELGYSKRLAVVIPPGAVWPLPAYELALMTARETSSMGRDVEITLITPETAPLVLFGAQASAALADELAAAGIRVRTGVIARGDGGGLVIEPSGEPFDADRIVAIPRLLGPGIAGVPADDAGFVIAGDDARVAGCERTWAAGDGVASPVKFGGLATHQARRAISAMAARAGVADVPDPGEPVLHGHLLVGGRSRRLAPGGDAAGAPLWWPGGKIAGEYLPRWLAEHDLAPQAIREPPRPGVPVHRPLSELRDPAAQYLHDLAREFRGDDPALAALGRRMRATEDR